MFRGLDLLSEKLDGVDAGCDYTSAGVEIKLGVMLNGQRHFKLNEIYIMFCDLAGLFSWKIFAVFSVFGDILFRESTSRRGKHSVMGWVLVNYLRSVIFLIFSALCIHTVAIEYHI